VYNACKTRHLAQVGAIDEPWNTIAMHSGKTEAKPLGAVPPEADRGTRDLVIRAQQEN
jgi:hypothetical protein